MEPGGSQGLSNNSYPEPINPITRIDTYLFNNIWISDGLYKKFYFLRFIRLDYRLCDVMLEKILD